MYSTDKIIESSSRTPLLYIVTVLSINRSCNMFLQTMLGILIMANRARGSLTDSSEQNSTPGLLISGGTRNASTSVEVFIPSTGLSCSLPPLPDDRLYHTMDSTYTCGGVGMPSSDSCLHFSGQWTDSYTLVHAREGHSSWMTDYGLLLMGGYGLDSTGRGRCSI